MSRNTLIYLLVLAAIGALAYFFYFVPKQKDVSRGQPENSSEGEPISGMSRDGSVSVPTALGRAFPSTDWSKVDPSISRAISGGPGKDGIPAIDAPSFEPIANFKYPDAVLAIVLEDAGRVKVYPYNILLWHEIVNDTASGVPVAVTFCPLCGSAVVFDRRLPDGETTFGVSGFLLESNLVMYDRATESLWQQSTGRGLAGRYHGHELSLVPLQLLSIGEVKAKYPSALVLSSKTGHFRDYSFNPYSGYEESEDFFFSPSINDTRYPSKDIFVVFRVGEIPVATPFFSIENGKTYSTEVSNQKITISKKDGEISITGPSGEEIPFYFEMWFSFAVQNKDRGATVFDPKK